MKDKELLLEAISNSRLLSPIQIKLLKFLVSTSDNYATSIRTVELVDILGVPKSSIYSAIKVLELKKLITRVIREAYANTFTLGKDALDEMLKLYQYKKQK